MLSAAVIYAAIALQPTRQEVPGTAVPVAVAKVSAPVPLDPDARGEEGRSLLLAAVMQNKVELARELMEQGARVDVPDEFGVTPLMIAARRGDLELLQMLLARSVHPNATDLQGWSAAHHALLGKNREAFELLLPKVHRVESAGEDGRTLLEMACATGDVQLIKTVLQRTGGELPWRPETRAALRQAAVEGDVETVRFLLGKHAAMPTAEGSTVPLLAAAIMEDDMPLFTTLLGAGIDPNAILPGPPEKEFMDKVESSFLRSFLTSDRGLTVLMLAAGMGREDYVRALLDAGAERFRKTGRNKMIALYFASRTKKWRCVQMLLGKGPEPSELRVEISLSEQRATVFRNGVEIMKTPVSTGRKGFATPAGEFVVTDKKRSHRSSIYHVQMPFFMRLNCLDFGMHAGVVPNYPASHGCIRLPSEKAQKLFAEIPVGTLVTIN